MEECEMNRLDFLKELKASFFDTAKSICEPIVEIEIEKISNSTDRLLNRHWIYIGMEMSHFQQKYIKGETVFFIKNDSEIRAFSGICPTCTNLVVVSTMQATCRCLTCETVHNFSDDNETNNLVLTEYPVKKQDDGYYIGMIK